VKRAFWDTDDTQVAEEWTAARSFGHEWRSEHRWQNEMDAISPRMSNGLARFARVDWADERPEHYGSNIHLLQESVIRFARWARYFDAAPPPDYEPPFFDLAWCLESTFAPPFPENAREIIGRSKNYIAKSIFWWFLKWEALRDDRQVELRELDPFEPLVLCFERGGRPFRHHGFLHIEHSLSFTYGYGFWPDKFAEKQATPLSELDLANSDQQVNARMRSPRA
jgi:hypothetical protein